MWSYINRFVLWFPAAISGGYCLLIATLAAAVSAGQSTAKRILTFQVNVIERIFDAQSLLWWFLGGTVIWLTLFVFSGKLADAELLLRASEQVDRRKDRLEVWARKHFDPVYGELFKLALAVNEASRWDAFQQGKHHRQEELEVSARLIPSALVEDSIGFIEAQNAFLSALDRYQDEGRQLHLMEHFGISDIANFPGYRAWRDSDASFVVQLSNLIILPKLAKIRNVVGDQWGRWDREQSWPKISPSG